MTEQIIILTAILSFLIIGFFAKSKKQSEIGDYSISRKKLSWLPIAGGVSMTYIGGAALLNTSSLAYTYGYYPMVDALAFFIGIIIVLFFIKRIWNDKGVTVADLVSGSNRKLSVLIGLISTLVFILILSAQFVAIGKLLGPYFPQIHESLLIVIPSVLIYLYVFRGGFKSVTMTDLLQLLFVTLFLMLPVFIMGFTTKGISNNAIHEFQTMPINLMVLLSISLIYIPLSQDINIRVKSAKNILQAKIGLIVGALIYIGLLFSVTWIGMELAKHGVSLNDGEQAFSVYFKHFYPSIGVFSVLAALAAIISSMDSFALNAITTLSNDILTNKQSEKSVRRPILVSGGIVLLVALIIALYFKQILAIILGGVILYVSIIGSIAFGRYIGLRDNFTFYGSIFTIVLLVGLELSGLEIANKAIVYPLLASGVVILSRLIQKMIKK